MSADQAALSDAAAGHRHEQITVTVNNKAVVLGSHRVTGLEIKEAAIAQGVDIQLDFHLVLEAHGGQPARRVGNDERITVTRDSVFSANDGDDDS